MNKKEKPTALFTVFIFLTVFIPLFLSSSEEVPPNPGEKKVYFLNQKARGLRNNNPKRAADYALQGLKLAREIGYTHGEGEALWNLSTAYYNLADQPKALDYAKQSLTLFRGTGDKKWIGRTLNNLGTVYLRSNKINEAMTHFNEALAIGKETGNKSGISEALFNIGIIYSDRGQWDTALEYHLEGLKLLEEEGEKLGISTAYSTIALLYENLKDYKRSLFYLEKAEKLKEEIDDRIGLAYVFSNSGTVYRSLKQYPKALEYYSRALKIRESIGDRKGIASALNNIGLVHHILKDYSKALEYEKRALKIREELGDPRDTAYSYLNMANTYYGKKDFTKALESLKKSYKIARGMTGADVLVNQIVLGLSETYAARQDYKQAWSTFKLYYSAEKKMLGEKTRKQLDELQIKYETEKKEKEIEMLKKDNELKIKENEVLTKDKELDQLRLSRTRIARNAFIAGFILISVILGLLFNRYLYLFAFWKKQKYVGKFRLMEKLGSGAMGTVYKAHSVTSKSEPAAVKLLKEELFTDETSKRRFIREAAIIDKLHHPHIVTIFETGQAGQTLYIAMELLKGKPLDRLLSEEGPFPIDRCLHMLIQVSDALVFIHSQNVIHRDLKPANIMVMEKDGDPDFVKLLDFGLARMEFQAKLTQSGNFVGTLEYISPEQLLDAETSPANDIFSLGVTFYHVLCSESPFPGDTPIDIMRGIIKGEPAPPSRFRPEIPDTLDRLVMRMIDKTPDRRPPAQDVLEALNSIGSGRGIS
jgi:tetratricopeptide (TPR) repeat protein